MTTASPDLSRLEICEVEAAPADHDGFILDPAVDDLAKRLLEVSRQLSADSSVSNRGL
jgi:hypothetical protein